MIEIHFIDVDKPDGPHLLERHRFACELARSIKELPPVVRKKIAAINDRLMAAHDLPVLGIVMKGVGTDGGSSG